MKEVFVDNVNSAVAQALPYLLEHGIREESRNGAVIVAPGPVMTVYVKPLERVLFAPARDANPFFHVMESLWMLAGRNDVEFPAKFAQRLYTYSDDGKIMWGAYGWRWKEFFGFDQLEVLIQELKTNPNTRRAVLAMWNGMDMTSVDDVSSDLFNAVRGGKDVPCNTHAYFDVRGGKLNMTVCNRSNDAIWGCYGANAVHFAFLLEYMAEQIGVPVGVYRQFSNNFHAYTDFYNEEALKEIAEDAGRSNLYQTYPDTPIIPLGSTLEGWEEDLERLMRRDGVGNGLFNTPFFNGVAVPLYLAWESWKGGERSEALRILGTMPHSDWQINAIDWMMRRKEKKNAA